MKKTLKDMQALIAEYKEYQALAEELKQQMDELKAEAIEILGEAALDEYACDSGKVTYRQVLSNRFATTEFKKVHGDLYKAFTKQTSCMKFTCN